MPCALCGKEGKLIAAHVLPRSFHRIDPSERQPPRLLTNVAGRYAQKLPKGAYDSGILCEGCERQFSAWDDYAAELFLTGWSKFERLDHHGEHMGFRVPAYDYDRLKLFFISLLWRAAVSSHTMFYQVEIGPHENILRRAILSRDPGEPDHYGVFLQAFDSTEVGMLNPHSERFSGVRFYRFYLAQIIAYIKVDTRPVPPPFSVMMLRPRADLTLAIKNFATSPEREIMRNLVVSDKRRARR